MAGLWDAFVTKFNPTGSLVYSTFLGGSQTDLAQGIAVDTAGNAYVTGTTASKDFPLKAPLQNKYAAIFVAKIGSTRATTTALSSSMNPSTHGQPVTFTAAVTSKNGAPPNGELVTFMKGKKVLGTGPLSRGSASFTTSTLPVGSSTIEALYGGDEKFGGSTSNVVTQVVNRAEE
jgi:hypothetical protein